MLLFFVMQEKYNIRLYINKLVLFDVVDYTKKQHTYKQYHTAWIQLVHTVHTRTLRNVRAEHDVM